MKEQNDMNKENQDIIDLILEHHKPLKELIKTLKDTDAEAGERLVAFEKFAPLLLTHAQPEEMALYAFMKQDEELIVEGMEGETEHTLASQLIDEIYATEEEHLWSAKVKVLAEMVEHHIKEEEQTMLPDFKENSDESERIVIAREYLKLRNEMMNSVGSESFAQGEAIQAH